MRHIRDRFQDVFRLLAHGEAAAALELLEGMRDEALADSDRGTHATFLQTLANALDDTGRPQEALEAAERALVIDRDLWPESRGTYLSLHSIVIILRRLGRKDAAAARAKELLVLGEKLGAADFAAAAVFASEGMPLSESRALLSRARFACEVALRETKPTQEALFELAISWAQVTFRLGRIYADEKDFDRAERVFGEVTPLLARFVSRPSIARKLGISWVELARVAGLRGARDEERFFYHCALALLTSAADRSHVTAALARIAPGAAIPDAALDFFSIVRTTESSVVIAHPKRGWFSVARELAGNVAPFDRVAVSFDDQGRVRSVQI